MNIKNILVYFFLAFIISKCVNPVDGPPPDETKPIITIFSPTSNDTIFVGQTPIYYEAIDDNGVEYYELFVNDSLVKTYEQIPNAPNTSIFLELDKNKISERISYYIKVIDISGNETTTEKETNILISEERLPPKPPTNLILNRLSNRIYNLYWVDQSNNELFFELWRKADTSSFIHIKDLPKNSVSTNDTIESSLLTYTYIVKATNTSGSTESNVVSTIPDAASEINHPTNLRATAYGTSRIKLIWKDNSNNELAFKIERKISSSTQYVEVGLANANDTIFVDTAGLFPSTEYTYRILAISQFGLSNYSNTVTVATLIHDINPPANFTSNYNSDDNTVKLNWIDNSIFDIETRIERSGIDKKFVEIGIAGANKTSYQDSAVTRGTIYFYRIRSYTIDGYYSEYTEEVKVEL